MYLLQTLCGMGTPQADRLFSSPFITVVICIFMFKSAYPQIYAIYFHQYECFKKPHNLSVATGTASPPLALPINVKFLQVQLQLHHEELLPPCQLCELAHCAPTTQPNVFTL